MAIRPRVRNGHGQSAEVTTYQQLKTLSTELAGLRATIDALAQKSQQVLSLANAGELDEKFAESKLAKHASIQSALLAEYDEMFSGLRDGALRTLLEVSRIAFSSRRDLLDEHGNLKPIHELSDDVAATISDVSVITKQDGSKRYKYKQWDKNKALGLLIRHFGLLRDVVEHQGPGGGPINVNVTAQPIPLDRLSIEGKRQILAILVREGITEGAIDVESRLLEETTQMQIDSSEDENENESENEDGRESRVAAFPIAD
jgi:hypothetical protein